MTIFEESHEVNNLKPIREDYQRVILAYQIATSTYPTKEIIDTLLKVGIDRCLEILLVMKQSKTPIKNPFAFIVNAIEKGWTPSTLPAPIKKHQTPRTNTTPNETVFTPYNWLED